MKSSELIELTQKELLERLDNERDYLLRLRLNHAISPLDNPKKITETRKNIARIMTEINKRERTGSLTEKNVTHGAQKS